MQMDSTVLLFNISGTDLKALHRAAAAVGATVKEVSQADFAQSVGALIGVLPRAQSICLSPFPEALLIMCAFTRAQMEQFLDILKAQAVYIPYKAMVTPTNLTWQCDALIGELKKEHEQIRRMKQSHE